MRHLFKAGSSRVSLARWRAMKTNAQEAWLRSLGGRRSRFELRTFTGSAGSRNYRLYAPATGLRAPCGLLVMLHGCTQTAEEFALATGMNAQAKKHGLVVVYPEQPQLHHRKACWNWYRPADQHRGAGEPAIIAELTQHLMAEFAIDPRRVFVAGLSAGGAMAAVMGRAYPDLYAGVGVHSGVPCGLAVNAFSALSAMKGHAGWASLFQRLTSEHAAMRTIVFHGTADRTVHPRNAEDLVAAAAPNANTQERQEMVSPESGRPHTVSITTGADGFSLSELWLIEGSGHAWSGGSPESSFTDPSGPNASAEMVRFFLQEDQPKSRLPVPERETAAEGTAAV